MESVTIVLLLLLAVVLSDSLSRALPWPIPLPLVQIAFGAGVGFLADFRPLLPRIIEKQLVELRAEDLPGLSDGAPIIAIKEVKGL